MNMESSIMNMVVEWGFRARCGRTWAESFAVSCIRSREAKEGDYILSKSDCAGKSVCVCVCVHMVRGREGGTAV